jgi:hypothetical protein
MFLRSSKRSYSVPNPKRFPPIKEAIIEIFNCFNLWNYFSVETPNANSISYI